MPSVEAVEMATLVIKNAMRQIMKAHWVNGCYRNDQQCGYCNWWATEHHWQETDHFKDCPVHKAREIIKAGLETI